MNKNVSGPFSDKSSDKKNDNVGEYHRHVLVRLPRGSGLLPKEPLGRQKKK